jgi:STAS domain
MSDAPDQPGRVPYRRTPPTTQAAQTPAAQTPPARRPTRYVRTTGFVLISEAVRDADRISIAGELTVGTAALLDAETVDLCRDPGRGAVDLVLDLTEVTFLDVMGVAALRRVHYRVLLRGELRLGLPVAAGPRRLLALAFDHGWLPLEFCPSTPAY